VPASPRLILLSVAPLLFAAAIFILGNGLFGTLLAVRMDLEGYAVDRIGLILACYSVSFVVGTRAVPPLVERVGHIRTFAALAAVAATTALLHALVPGEIAWAALRAVTGICMAGLYTIVESWLNARATNAVRGTVTSAYMAVNFLAYGGAQLLLPLMDPTGFQLFSLVAILVAISLVPLALARVETPPQIVAERLGLRRLIAISPLGVAGCFAAGLINGAFTALGPFYARTVEDSVDWIASFMALAVISGFVLQYPLGRLSDRFDRRTVLLCLTAALGVAALAAWAVADVSRQGLVVLICLYGGLSYTIYPISLTHANDYIPEGGLVGAAAGLLMVFGIGSVLGPILASQAMTPLGAGGLFVHIAVVSAALAVFTVVRMRRREALPPAEQSPFVAVPLTTAEAVTLDPRSEPLPEDGEAGGDGDGGGDDRQLAFDFAAPGGPMGAPGSGPTPDPSP